MGPLVPDIIGNELNFIAAIIIGFAFGFILEQAGFSTSKKLVGLFYGYDFTVLRVFFTAGITAMMGVVALNYFGLLDVSLIYINPTFLWSAIIGGLIMGIGFIVGGFCPGTSVCAAAIGKIDALIFILGSVIGVSIFAEGYPIFEKLYLAENWGNIRMFELLNISQSLFAFILVIVAVGAFWMVTFIEKKVNGEKTITKFQPAYLYYSLTAIVVIIGITAFIMPDRKNDFVNYINVQENLNKFDFKYIDSDELAFRIIDNDKSINIFDFRSKSDFDSLSLPNSTNLAFNNLFEKDAHKLLSLENKKNIFIANDELESKKAAALAGRLGYTDIYVLKGGLNEFKNEIIYFQKTKEPTNRQEIDTYKFRAKASAVIPELIKENKNKNKNSGENKPKRIIGGC